MQAGNASSTPNQWDELWAIGKTPCNSYRYFVRTHLLKQLCKNHLCPYYSTQMLTVIQGCIQSTTSPIFHMPSEILLPFLSLSCDDGVACEELSQLPNTSYTDKTGGSLALSHWKELASQILFSFRCNPYALEYRGCLPLQMIELSTYAKLQLLGSKINIQSVIICQSNLLEYRPGSALILF